MYNALPRAITSPIIIYERSKARVPLRPAGTRGGARYKSLYASGGLSIMNLRLGGGCARSGCSAAARSAGGNSRSACRCRRSLSSMSDHQATLRAWSFKWNSSTSSRSRGEGGGTAAGPSSLLSMASTAWG